jgi:hypothetical protein
MMLLIKRAQALMRAAERRLRPSATKYTTSDALVSSADGCICMQMVGQVITVITDGMKAVLTWYSGLAGHNAQQYARHEPRHPHKICKAWAPRPPHSNMQGMGPGARGPWQTLCLHVPLSEGYTSAALRCRHITPVASAAVNDLHGSAVPSQPANAHFQYKTY